MRVPPSGGSSVVRMRTAVVLPAPFGPSRPSTLPACDAQVDAAERLDVAVALAQPLCLDCCGRRHHLTLAKACCFARQATRRSGKPKRAKRPGVMKAVIVLTPTPSSVRTSSASAS